MCRSAQGKPRKGAQTLAGVRSSAHNYYMRCKMDLELIGQLVTTLGFPIVMCGALFWFVNKQEERRKEELEGMRKALTENTTVLSSLKDLIQVILTKVE